MALGVPGKGGGGGLRESASCLSLLFSLPRFRSHPTQELLSFVIFDCEEMVVSENYSKLQKRSRLFKWSKCKSHFRSKP